MKLESVTWSGSFFIIIISRFHSIPFLLCHKWSCRVWFHEFFFNDVFLWKWKALLDLVVCFSSFSLDLTLIPHWDRIGIFASPFTTKKTFFSCVIIRFLWITWKEVRLKKQFKNKEKKNLCKYNNTSENILPQCAITCLVEKKHQGTCFGVWHSLRNNNLEN